LGTAVKDQPAAGGRRLTELAVPTTTTEFKR